MTSAAHPSLFLKIGLALLPTLIFTQNVAWMTGNRWNGIAFLVLWAVILWSGWKIANRNRLMERYFRYTEIAFFLLPVSAIVLALVVGSEQVGNAVTDAEQAGAAIGTAIGGMFVAFLAFLIGIPGGFIFHIIAGRYEKRADAAK